MQVHLLTHRKDPALHVWRDPTARAPATLAQDVPPLPEEGPGAEPDALRFRTFQVPADFRIHEALRVLVREGDQWEDRAWARTIPRLAEYRFPEEVWIVDGTSRVLLDDPRSRALDRVRVRLITARKYRSGRLFLWVPGRDGRWVEAGAPPDEDGPWFDVDLAGPERHLFLFKFRSDQHGWEPDYANRVWSSSDGAEVWGHSQAAEVSTRPPARRTLTVHLLGRPGATMRVWQANSDFETDVPATEETTGTLAFQQALYTGRPYGFMFHWGDRWEHAEAKREATLESDRAIWTIEGDHELFAAAPRRDRRIRLTVAEGPPGFPPGPDLLLDAWVNQDGPPLAAGLPGHGGVWELDTYPEIVTAFRFRRGARAEGIPRHALKIGDDEREPVHRYVVLERPDTLSERPVSPLFSDPPFEIRRPGAWTEAGRLRFAVHAPTAAAVDVIGEFTGWEATPLAMRITRDGAYWWAETSLAGALGAAGQSSLHGIRYKFRLNGIQPVQDPAADWVESSSPEKASRLVDHERHRWQDAAWRRPGWEYLIVYQLHPARFSSRFSGEPLERVRRELEDLSGYRRGLGVTALALLPVNEFAGDQSWGYNPAFFYAIESSYGGPDLLKALVDACHRHGMAVILDVVFNHAGTLDNALWSVARESFFKGDSTWGALVNFEHPQVIHFFERNLAALMEHYHVDGFRFDATWVIRHAARQSGLVPQPGSGEGWAFMHRLRQAVRAIDPRCILIAEHLPNEWDLTRYGGPMDSQWHDAFHDRVVEACRGWAVMPALAEALQVTHTHCQQWYEALNYSESHDEVGNVNDRIAHVAGFGQGLRRNKVAAAATVLARGIPMWFMGEESGEWRQFLQGSAAALDLDAYERDPGATKVRAWWRSLCDLRRGTPALAGPAPTAVHHAEGSALAFSRGERADYFVLLNFGWLPETRPLRDFGLPDGVYRERLNSTWAEYRVEEEDVRDHGGPAARLGRSAVLSLPEYGAIVLERT